MKHILFFQVLFTLLSLPLHAQSPCACLNNETLDCTQTDQHPESVTISGNSLTFRVSDSPRSLGINPNARYKAFWIFGDGNFKYYPHGDMTADLATLTQPYTYHRTGTYHAEPLLSEKKSNREPPAYSARVVTVTSTPDQGTTFTTTLTGGNNTLDLLNSDKFRPKYPTGFALSIPADNANKGVYFFYNSRAENGSYVPDDVQTLEKVLLPDYVRSANLNYTQGLTSNLPDELANGISSLTSKFKNYIYLQVNTAAISNMPGGFSEYRFFPFLKTIWEEGLPSCQVAAISVGNTAPSGSFYTDGRLAQLTNAVDKLFPGTGVSSNFQIGSNSGGAVYVRGATVFDIEMLGVIDPNGIRVTDVKDLKNGFFRATCQLEACNKGRLAEDLVFVTINDHNHLFSNLNVLSSDTISTVVEQISKSGVHQWIFEWTALLDEVPWEGAFDKNHTEICNDLFFSVEMNAEGLKRLIEGDGLELCTRFSLANTRHPEECVCNSPKKELQGSN
ncbi:MAG: hypothetical protein JNN28_21305 [Saprospiraceae bacterium]|nr:hypothetical protein [Saprospiraceae bacterium]